jgi:hypothetical protein
MNTDFDVPVRQHRMADRVATQQIKHKISETKEAR